LSTGGATGGELTSPLHIRAATVVRTEAGANRRLASHPVLFPFPSVATSSVEEAVAWLAHRLGDR
jgi:hypothetical protein